VEIDVSDKKHIIFILKFLFSKHGKNMMKIFKKLPILVFTTFLSVGLFGCDKGKEALGISSNAPPLKIDIGDVKTLGNNLVGKKISIKGHVNNAYPCKYNEGYQCLVMVSYRKDSPLVLETILVKDGLYDFAFYKSILITKERFLSYSSGGTNYTLPGVNIVGTVKLFNYKDEGG
jgi:hypothetical protein